MNLTEILAIALALCIGGGAILWNRYEAASARADKAEAQLATHANNDQVVTKYVEKIVSVPGPVVVRDRLVRGLCVVPRVPGQPGADGNHAADALPGLPDGAGDFQRGLSDDLRTAAIAKHKLDAIQAELKPQL